MPVLCSRCIQQYHRADGMQIMRCRPVLKTRSDRLRFVRDREVLERRCVALHCVLFWHICKRAWRGSVRFVSSRPGFGSRCHSVHSVHTGYLQPLQGAIHMRAVCSRQLLCKRECGLLKLPARHLFLHRGCSTLCSVSAWLRMLRWRSYSAVPFGHVFLFSGPHLHR
jgi:hypothetical protein